MMKIFRWNSRTVLLAAAIGLWLAAGSAVVKASAAADEQFVAALDTQYQAAVAKNDATAMNRILADDFILVTGKAKSSRRRIC
jgi:hypothetical protein